MASWIFRPVVITRPVPYRDPRNNSRFINFESFMRRENRWISLPIKQSTGNNKTVLVMRTENCECVIDGMTKRLARDMIATRHSVGDNASFIIAFRLCELKICERSGIFWVVGNPLEPLLHSQTLIRGLKILERTLPIKRSSVSASLFINKATNYTRKPCPSRWLNATLLSSSLSFGEMRSRMNQRTVNDAALERK